MLLSSLLQAYNPSGAYHYQPQPQAMPSVVSRKSTVPPGHDTGF
jgi:hypothetical protein